MIVLDTDHMTLLERAASPHRDRLQSRLKLIPPEERATTIISFEEQMRGWLAILAKGRSLVDQIKSYKRLSDQLDTFCRIQVFEFDEHAAVEFQRLRQDRIRIGTMDLKIAAIALARRAKLLSRNLRDFRKVPGLDVEDWVS